MTTAFRMDETRFREHLEALEIQQGQDVVVHSQLISFGRFERAAETIYRVLRERVGKDATIAVPTYTLDLGEEGLYDRDVTPSDSGGVFSEYLRSLPDAVRSRSPIHSHAALGPGASLFEQSAETVSLGRGSDFEAMHDSGYQLLLLGVGFNRACTFLHHMEALMEVPYREWLALGRRVMSDHGPERVQVNYFARRDYRAHANFDVIVPLLEASGHLRQSPAPVGVSYTISLDQLYRCSAQLLQKDPYALVIKG